jgi:hypothetical protein
MEKKERKRSGKINRFLLKGKYISKEHNQEKIALKLNNKCEKEIY